ncbi:MAG: GMC family oxidoreductase [Saprospiraceae bacterium]|nr:GMC family oxidoreductase [Saprospiraceae bacterium]
MYFNSQGEESITYDAIVIGSGISGGFAAKELCEKGLKTLVLERGKMIRHPDYPTANLDPWDFKYRDRLPASELIDYPVQSRDGHVRESTRHLWVNDHENPYQEVKPFAWLRGYHVGGRSLMWGRQCYRWSDLDFEANARDGFGVDWPVRYADIAPWYDYVESFAGVSGAPEGLPQLPDGKFLPPMELNCVEQHLREQLQQHYTDRVMTIGRAANLTQSLHGRGACQFRNRCNRGCPYGAYFSSNAATLPAAEATGNLTLRPHSIVHTILFDDETQRAAGVLVLDAEARTYHEYRARVIFCCASALGTTWILLNSTSPRFPDGLGNDSGELGHNLMDHHFKIGATGRIDGFDDKYYKGRRPNGTYLARFRNLDPKTPDSRFLRGYGYQGGASRSNWMRSVRELGIGAEIKDAMMEPGPWHMGLTGFGEMLPYHDNKVTLDTNKLDAYGLPTLAIDCEIKENEHAMRKDMAEAAAEMLEACGFRDVHTYDSGYVPGLGIHEMGTARMGHDPKTSVVNKHNQLHAVRNVYVTDGAFMTSSACQNPSITYMAFTARAADHAVTSLKKGEL